MSGQSIVILSPYFPPRECGLSSYSYYFAHQLSQQGRSVKVLTSSEFEGESDSNIEVCPLVAKWNAYHLFQGLSRTLEPDSLLLVQYVPQMYQRIGLCFYLPFALLWFRLIKGHRIHLMAHELAYPWLPGDPKSWILHLLHRFILALLTLAADNVFCSTDRYQKTFQQYFPWRKAHYLPVGSNVLPSLEQSPLPEDLKEWRDPQKKLVALFGSAHSSKRIPMVLSFLNDYAISDQSIQILYIGLSGEEVEKASGLQLGSSIFKAVGKKSNDQLPDYFFHMDYLICFFDDGMSARRGSALAGMAFGTPVLSTDSPFTDPILRDWPNLFLLDEKQFASQSLIVLKGERDNKQKEIGRQKFADYFSWEKIVKRYLYVSEQS